MEWLWTSYGGSGLSKVFKSLFQKVFYSWESSRRLMALRMNSWSLVRTLICLEMWSKESSKSELDVTNLSIYRGSLEVS